MDIQKVEHPGALEDQHVFTSGEEPPRYAVVTVHEGDFHAAGPMSQQQLDIELRPGQRMTDDEIAVADEVVGGYRATIYNANVAGNYPGGVEQAARNLASFVLGERLTG